MGSKKLIAVVEDETAISIDQGLAVNAPLETQNKREVKSAVVRSSR